MKPYCEIIVSMIIPGIRSLITKELLTTQGLTQKQTADMLGLTQAAVSQYNREARGFKAKMLEKNPEIMGMIDSLTKEIVSGMDPKQIHSRFCEICKAIRKNRLVCDLHQESYPEIAPCSGCQS